VKPALEVLLIVVSGLALVAVGVTGLASPAALFDPLGVALPTAAGRNEVRAAYGAMHLAVGLLLLAGARRRELRRPALWLVFAFMGGLALGRAVSLAVDGSPGGFVVRLWIPEALAGAVAGTLLWAGRQHGDHPT
jgi:hypothetical protein